MNLQEAVKQLRVELGMSQEELARKIGVGKQSVFRWETGRCFPKKGAENRILAALKGMDVSEKCKENLTGALEAGRRIGTSAAPFGFPGIDMELLCQMAESSSNAIYAIEAGTYQILYANKATEQWSKVSQENAVGKKCFEYMRRRNVPCEDCPYGTRGENINMEQIIKNFSDNRYLKTHGKKIKWNGKEVYITYASDVTEYMELKRQLEEMKDNQGGHRGKATNCR